MRKLIILMGIPASGKSTYAKEIVEFYDSALHVSRDEIRFSKLQKGEDYFAHEDEVLTEFFENINHGMREYDITIADATHATWKSRAQLWRNINIPDDVRVIGIWFDISPDKAISRNKNRSGLARVPHKVIRNMHKNRCYPRDYEGFDKIIYKEV